MIPPFCYNTTTYRIVATGPPKRRQICPLIRWSVKVVQDVLGPYSFILESSSWIAVQCRRSATVVKYSNIKIVNNTTRLLSTWFGRLLPPLPHKTAAIKRDTRKNHQFIQIVYINLYYYYYCTFSSYNTISQGGVP